MTDSILPAVTLSSVLSRTGVLVVLLTSYFMVRQQWYKVLKIFSSYVFLQLLFGLALQPSLYAYGCASRYREVICLAYSNGYYLGTVIFPLLQLVIFFEILKFMGGHLIQIQRLVKKLMYLGLFGLLPIYLLLIWAVKSETNSGLIEVAGRIVTPVTGLVTCGFFVFLMVVKRKYKLHLESRVMTIAVVLFSLNAAWIALIVAEHRSGRSTQLDLIYQSVALAAQILFLLAVIKAPQQPPTAAAISRDTA